MADNELREFETWLTAEFENVPAVKAAVNNRIRNSVIGRLDAFPLLVFKVIPLDDNKGQKGVSIQTKFICDIKIVSEGAPTDETEDALVAIKSHFKEIVRTPAGNSILSMRHDRAISFEERESGNDVETFYFHRGGSFRVWMSPAP